MKLTRVPIQKIGTVFQRPSWRYDAVSNPLKYGFRGLCTRQKSSASSYKRMLLKGLSYTVTYKVPSLFKKLAKELPLELSEQLDKVWEKHYRKTNKTRNKIRFNGIENIDHFVSWNMAKVAGLNDPWLKKLIYHVFNVQFSEEIEYAINLGLTKELLENKRFIGYEIFAGKSNNEIAKNWHITPKRVEALRMLYFDFSHFPKDKIAQWALLRQLKENDDIPAEEFGLYKRVFDMGALGLKAQLCHNHLNDKEREQVADFLAKSAMENTFNLQFTVRTSKDALMYNKVISDLAKLQLQREEIKNRQAELRLMELQITKLRKEVSVDTDITQPEDLKLLQDHITSLSYKDGNPTFLSVTDLHPK